MVRSNPRPRYISCMTTDPAGNDPGKLPYRTPMFQMHAQLMAEQPGAITLTLALHCRRSGDGCCNCCSGDGQPAFYPCIPARTAMRAREIQRSWSTEPVTTGSDPQPGRQVMASLIVSPLLDREHRYLGLNDISPPPAPGYTTVCDPRDRISRGGGAPPCASH